MSPYWQQHEICSWWCHIFIRQELNRVWKSLQFQILAYSCAWLVHLSRTQCLTSAALPLGVVDANVTENSNSPKVHSDQPAKLKKEATFVAPKHLSGFSKGHSSLVLRGGPDCFRDTFKDAPVENPTLVLRSSALPNLTLVKPAPEARAEMYNIGVRAGVMIAGFLLNLNTDDIRSLLCCLRSFPLKEASFVLWTRPELTWLTLMTFAPPLGSKRALASAVWTVWLIQTWMQTSDLLILFLPHRVHFNNTKND